MSQEPKKSKLSNKKSESRNPISRKLTFKLQRLLITMIAKYVNNNSIVALFHKLPVARLNRCGKSCRRELVQHDTNRKVRFEVRVVRFVGIFVGEGCTCRSSQVTSLTHLAKTTFGRVFSN